MNPSEPVPGAAEIFDEWDQQRIALARDEYHLEIAKQTSFTASLCTWFALLAGATILAPFSPLPANFTIALILKVILLIPLAALYCVVTDNIQYRCPLKTYLYRNEKLPDIIAWGRYLCNTYDHAVTGMQQQRRRQRLLVGIATAFIVIGNMIIHLL